MHAPGAYARSIDRQALRQRIVRQQRASRSATRQRVVPAPTPKPVTAAARPSDDQIWQRLRNCEAGGRYERNSGNGYYGAYQFSAGTWRSLGYKGLPHQAPPEVQDEAARKLQARSGWGQWPACSRRIGAR
ncbi:MAG TPA: transglycosylase family protein [Acidimicrobiia bacterium]|nr:transglycosylase family protein [Acidimicrobiia bacterium]